MNGREKGEQTMMTDSVNTNELADRLLKVMPHLQQWAVATVQANRPQQDLSLRQLAVLFRIREGTVFPGLLARRLRISPAVVTGLLDRLEHRGYVRRRMDPGDRRRQHLELTDSGRAASEAVHQTLSRELAEQFNQSPAADLEALWRALGVLEVTVAALESRAPKLGPGPAENDEMWEEEVAAASGAGSNTGTLDTIDSDDDVAETAAAAG
jgi:DNA-binding MarR family transcriptional regulator